MDTKADSLGTWMKSVMDAQQMDMLMDTQCVIPCVIVGYGCSADGLTDAQGHC